LFGKNLEIGTALSCQTNYPYNAHAAALVATGLDGLGYSLYSWKHTGAVRAYESGLDIKKLQRLLRHSSLTITDIYLRSLNVVNDIESLKGW
jgi:integrase